MIATTATSTTMTNKIKILCVRESKDSVDNEKTDFN